MFNRENKKLKSDINRAFLYIWDLRQRIQILEEELARTGINTGGINARNKTNITRNKKA